MKITRILAALFALLVASPSFATTQWPTVTGAPADTSVGSIMFGCENGSGQWVPATTAGQCLGSGGGGGSTSPFQANGLYASLTATAVTSASTALPTGTTTTVRMTNLGAGTVSCTFATGTAAGLVNNTQIGPGGSVSRAIGSYDHVACIDQTGSSGSQLVIIEGGTGLGNDTAGANGGAVTLASGADVTEGGLTDTPATLPASATSASVVALLKAIANTGQYPAGAVALTASATGTTAATTATLAGTTGKTTYVCGYSIRANATANTNVTDTLTGVVTGTMSSALWVPANTAGLGVDEQIFSPCIPASATNTGIAAVSGAPGTGGVVTVKAWGYQL